MIKGSATLGRRERKKLQTRRTLAESALRLFLERGYDAVTVAEIAEEADTAVTTLFKHFPHGKESLVFDGGIELELGAPPEDRPAALAAAIRDRTDGIRVLDAVEQFIGARGPFATGRSSQFERQLQLILETPALRAYARRQWIECEDPLAAVMAEASGQSADGVALRALVRFILETPSTVGNADAARTALATVFDRLRTGWPEH